MSRHPDWTPLSSRERGPQEAQGGDEPGSKPVWLPLWTLMAWETKVSGPAGEPTGDPGWPHPLPAPLRGIGATSLTGFPGLLGPALPWPTQHEDNCPCGL